jgi:tetratricopeptide (TPR) repeat protein
MTSDGHRSARAAFDAARASFQRLATGAPSEGAAAFAEAWQGTQRALRALAGTEVLEGVALVRELRQRNLLSLEDAHALVDFHAAVERTRGEGATPTPGDVQAAASARERLERLLSPGPDEAGPAPYSGPVSPPRTPPPASAPPPPVEVAALAARHNYLGAAFVALAVVAVIAVALFAWRGMSREPSALRQGRAAFAAGDRLTAKNAFLVATTEAPTLAEPHIYLGRIARDEGNRAAASAELRRAVELEPNNPLAHRELAAYLLATGQLDLARSFYARAIELAPDDRVALGFMACTLHRMGRTDLAARFFQRAGAGEWVQCQAAAPPPPVTAPLSPPGQPPAAPR